MSQVPDSPPLRGERAPRRLELRQPVRCTDGRFATLQDVVIDPIERRVTHLVVQPERGPGEARLVPIGRATASEDGLRLDCTIEEAGKLQRVHEAAYLRLGEFPTQDPDWDVGIRDVYALPYYGTGAFVDYQPDPDLTMVVTYDRIPKGEVEVRRGSDVLSSDGHHVGRVEGFLVDQDAITHIVLERGHLLHRREVTIPIGAVARVRTDEVTLTMTESQVDQLRSLSVHRWQR